MNVTLLIGPLVGALAGALFTLMVQGILGRRQNDLAEINEYISEISRVEEAGCAYWSHSAAEFGADNRSMELAARLRGAMAVTTVFDGRVKALLGPAYQAYHELDGRLFDIATGGKFEQHDQKADPDKMVQICIICHQMRFTLRCARTGRFSLGACSCLKRCWDWTVDTFTP